MFSIAPLALPAGRPSGAAVDSTPAPLESTTMATCFEAPPPEEPLCVYDQEDGVESLLGDYVVVGQLHALSTPMPPAEFLAPAAAVDSPPAPLQSTTMATCLEAPAPESPCFYDEDYMESLIGDLVHELYTTRTPTPPAGFLSRSKTRYKSYLDALVRGIKKVQIVEDTPTGCFAGPHEHDDTPRTPVAVLQAPASYGNDIDAATGSVIKGEPKTTDHEASKEEEHSSWTYDVGVYTCYREKEMDPAERPSEDYMSTTQKGLMLMGDRAALVAWMYVFSRTHGLPSSTLHRAVSYVDRLLSVKMITGANRLYGAVAVFVAGKYEECRTNWVLTTDDVARDVGGNCTRCEIIAAECELIAALGYRLGGPTAYTFVDLFTTHVEDSDMGAALRSLAHHLADMALLDYRCVPILPSAVAATAIVLAWCVVINSPAMRGLCFYFVTPSELSKTMGYTTEDLTDAVEAIYAMHEHSNVWPGCALMMANYEHTYALPPR